MSIRKLFLSLTFSLLALCSFAQGEICREICGAKFGDSYTIVKNILERKFGEPNPWDIDKTYITYRGVSYGGIYFTTIYFYFQYSPTGFSYFNRCIMASENKTAKEAISKRDAIKSVLAKKYKMTEAVDDDGFKYYYGGESPQQDDFGFCIDVIKLDDGTYAARLDYGPYQYIDEEF